MRSYSMKPVTFPMMFFLSYGPCRLFGRDGLLLFGRCLRRSGLGLRPFFGMHFTQRALVLDREHLDELAARRVPVVQQFAGALAAGPAVVVFQQLA